MRHNRVPAPKPNTIAYADAGSLDEREPHSDSDTHTDAYTYAREWCMLLRRRFLSGSH
jgi:hypothetical protein